MSTAAGEVATAPRTAKAGKKPISERQRQERKLAYMLVAPAVIAMLAVTAYPIGYALWLSLHRSDLRFPDQSEWVGLTNYISVLGSGTWWNSVGYTFLLTGVTVALELIIGMALALVMHRVIFGRGIVRASILVPYGIVTVVAALAFRFAFTPDTGFIPYFSNQALLTEATGSFWVIVVTEVWKTTPFMALLLLAGLALVPDELHEAAKVDGANAIQRFFRITVPLIKPAILVALLFRTLDAFRVFDSVFILTDATRETVSITGYNQLIVRLNLGIGSAVSVLIFLLVILIAVAFVKGLGTQTPAQEGR